MNASSPRPARSGAKKTGTKLSTSLIVGLLLVPLSAVAAVALVNPEPSSQSVEDATAATTTTAVIETTTTAETTTSTTEIASTDDLAVACGEQGLELVSKEADASISPLEQAALDSLRAICSSEGMDLPGPPAPEAVVQTQTVVVASPPPATPTTTVTTSTDDGGDGSSVDSAAAEFEKEYAATVAYINKAIDEGAGGTEIDAAKQLLAEAGALADSGDYAAGMEKLAEARQKADAAPRRSHGDDDEGEHHGGDDGEYDD